MQPSVAQSWIEELPRQPTTMWSSFSMITNRCCPDKSSCTNRGATLIAPSRPKEVANARTVLCAWSHPSQPATSDAKRASRSEEHTSALQSLMRISYAVFCLKKQQHNNQHNIKSNT